MVCRVFLETVFGEAICLVEEVYDMVFLVW